ncbi:MAG: hypothetical protein CMJ80_09525 [Planctomycetaceae bacterium]|nr:hypothetical protein [Planctomycetaceae bacterium]
MWQLLAQKTTFLTWERKRDPSQNTRLQRTHLHFEGLESRQLLAVDLMPSTASANETNYVTESDSHPELINPEAAEDIAIRNGDAWWVGVSNGESSDDAEWGESPNVSQWSDIRVADVDGNGVDDIIGREPDGTLWTARSQEARFSIEPWGSWATDVDWLHVGVGDFNGDGLQEVVGFADGTWQVSGSTGTRFINETWAQWRKTAMWKDLNVADVNGDGLDDVVGRSEGGGWWVGYSNGVEFKTKRWTKWSNKVVWENVLFADVNGDRRDDVIGRTNGKWWVGLSTGIEFENSRWGSWSKNAVWSDVVSGDFNGDGIQEIAGRAHNRAWWVSLSNSSSFINERWGAWDKTTNWQDVQTADLNGDGRDDLLGREPNQVIAAISTGSDFFNTPWTELTATSAWNNMVAGQFALSGDQPPIEDSNIDGVDGHALPAIPIFDYENQPPTGDFNDDGVINDKDIDLLCAAIRTSPDDLRFDLTRDDVVNKDDYDYMIKEILGTTPGDANLDKIMNSEDLVQVFTVGKYETKQPAGWAEGDWNCDGVFNTDDLVAAMLANTWTAN